MALVNVRTYDAQAVVAKGVSLGGLSRITVAQGTDAVLREPDHRDRQCVAEGTEEKLSVVSCELRKAAGK